MQKNVVLWLDFDVKEDDSATEADKLNLQNLINECKDMKEADTLEKAGQKCRQH